MSTIMFRVMLVLVCVVLLGGCDREGTGTAGNATEPVVASDTAMTVDPALRESLVVFDDAGAHVYLDLTNREQVISQLASMGGSLGLDAFDDLLDCFERMTGTALPQQAGENRVPIRAERIDPGVDAASDDPLGLQGYSIVVSADGIMLSAPTSLGITNAVYDILFQWGCRWVMPGQIGEVIPQRDRLSLAYGTFRKHISMDSRVEGGVPADYTLWRARNRMGFERWLSFSHNWTRAIPPARYFKSHPEYYALIGGKRVPTQVATTNPDVIRLMIQAAKAKLRGSATLDSFNMDSDDNLDWDQSPQALAQDPPVRFRGLPSMSDRMVIFANAVGKGIEAEFPDKLVGFYAYSNHQLPPVDVKPRANVGIGFCRSGFDLLRYMPRDDVPSSKEYWKLLADWLAICDHVYCYEYDPISWTGGLPCPIYLERAAALKKQHDMGVLGCWTDNGPLHQAANYVNRYLEMRIKADASQEPRAVLSDMCHAFFGPAGTVMNTYYVTLAEVTNFADPARSLFRPRHVGVRGDLQ